MTRDHYKILVVYCLAGMIAILVGSTAGDWPPLWVVGLADLAGTLVVFGFSRYFDNASVYDPYWSVAPVFIASYWILSTPPGTSTLLRRVMVFSLVIIWSMRLTMNWARRWQGLPQEDWRYRQFRAAHGRLYWLVSFFGIHLMPTLLVFLGCLALRPAFQSQAAINALDLLALLVTAGAIWIEALADRQVDGFVQENNGSDQLLQTGLWSLSRHPNYFGEIMFWWGLALCAYAAHPASWWVIIGPLSITLLFVTISIPLMEKRLRARKPAYDSYIHTTSALIPWFKKSKR